MLYLRTFGGLTLLLDGRPLERVSTHRKRLVLLAVLAAAGPRGIARDKVLAMFWPESDTDRARASLKQAVFMLRRELGSADVILGAGELRLNDAVIESDLVAFTRALEAADTRKAVVLYAGEFLDGIRVGDEPEIERWIESQRGRLARDFRLALQQLTSVASSPADLAIVREGWERLAAEHPGDADAVSQLVDVTLRLRDIEGARRAAHAYDDYVRTEWGLSDERSLTAYVESEALRLGDVSLAPVDGHASLSASAAVPPQRLSRSRLIAASVAIVLIAVATAIAVIAHRASAASPMIPVVLIDADSAHGDARPLERSIIAISRATLARASSIRVIDARQMSLAQYVIEESVIDDGRNVHVVAEVRASDHDPRLVPLRLEADGSVGEAAFTGAQLGARLVGRLLGASSIALTEAAAQSTRSVSAIEEFTAGEAEYRAGRFAAAADAFQRAVGEDSTFAVGWYRLSVTCDWAGRVDCSYDAARRAAARADRLDEHTRLLLDGLQAWHASNREEAERIYAYITAHYPDDAEAWYQLGDARFHLGPFAGLPIEASRAPFERAARLDSSGPEALIHLARIAALRGDVRGADTLYSRAIAHSDPAGRAELVAMRAFTIHDTAAIRDFLRKQAPGESDQFLWLLAERLASYAGSLSASESIFRMLTSDRRPAATRSAAHTELGVLAIAHGRFMLADSEFAVAGGFDSPPRAARYALERRRLLRLLPDLPVNELPALESGTSADTGRAGDSPSEYAAPDLRDMAEARYGQSPAMVDAFLAGFEDRRPDSAIARRAMSLLERMTGARADSARALLSAMRAGRAFRDDHWNVVEQNVDLRMATPLWLPLMAVERYWHAVALMRTGRTSEAIQWFGSFNEVGPEQHTMEARAHLERARLLWARGDTAGAGADSRKVIELWGQGDAVLASLVDEARQMLPAPQTQVRIRPIERKR